MSCSLKHYNMRPVTYKILLTAALMPLATFTANAAPATSESSFNLVMFGLVSVIVVLMMAIAMLANVLKELAFAYRDKFRKERKDSTIIKSVALLVFAGLCAVKSFAQDGANKVSEEAASAPVSPYISGIPRGDFYAITGIIFFELILIFALLSMIYQMVRLLRNIPEKKSVMERILAINLLDYFNKSVAIKEEHTIIIPHDYDGIHELDNSLPPWWKWGFAMTIVFAFAYMWYYQVADGPNQIDEYTAAVAKGEEEKLAYLAKAGSSVDENTVTMILDAGKLADAQSLFKNTCAACHREDGGGAVGPNLTDDFWLHGGALKDVFKSVKYGWKDKGMPEWQHNMSAAQIAGITSYVKSLKGKKVIAGKAPQGELFVEGGDKAIDSVSNKTEPSLTPVAGKENKDNQLAPFRKERQEKGIEPKKG